MCERERDGRERNDLRAPKRKSAGECNFMIVMILSMEIKVKKGMNVCQEAVMMTSEESEGGRERIQKAQVNLNCYNQKRKSEQSLI